MTFKKIVSFQIEEKRMLQLKKIALKEERSQSYILKKALNVYLDAYLRKGERNEKNLLRKM